MDEDQYEDYLVDKAKELLNEQVSDVEKDLEKPEMKNKRSSMDEKAEEESTSEIPFTWDPREIQHLVENRKSMSNDELKEFLKKDSKVQEEINELDEWKGFTRWEERFMVQNHTSRNTEEIAEQLGRDEREVRLKMRVLGLKVGEV